MPSIVLKYFHCGNDTSNHMEGYFGTLKNLIDHKLQPLGGLIRALYIRGERLLISSINIKEISLPSDLLTEEDSNQVDTFLLSLILTEYLDLKEKDTL